MFMTLLNAWAYLVIYSVGFHIAYVLIQVFADIMKYTLELMREILENIWIVIKSGIEDMCLWLRG